MTTLNTTKTRMEPLTVLVDAPVLAKLKERALDNDRSLSAEVRRILRDAVETLEAAA